MDSEYLKKHVGDALTRGLTEVVQVRPHDPIEYLAYWLQKYVDNREHAEMKRKEKIQLEEEREEYEREMQRKKAMEEEQRMIAEQEALEKAEKEAQEKAEKEALERAEKEALEKAALEPDPAEEGTEQVLSEIPEPMPALNEGEEEEKNTENDEQVAKESISTETIKEEETEEVTEDAGPDSNQQQIES